MVSTRTPHISCITFFLLLGAVAQLTHLPVGALDKGDCPGCFSIVDKLRNAVGEATTVDEVSRAFLRLCEAAKRDSDEGKFCHFMGGQEESAKRNYREMAEKLSWGLSTDKICEHLRSRDSQTWLKQELGPVDAEQTDLYRAIKTLHSKLDVDADGEVNDLESKTFLESEQRNNHNNAHKLSYLHQDGKDRSITVDELWFSWTSSEVHNWTTDETVYWLTNYVELPEYSHLFEKHSINGTQLPRIAADSSFTSRLGITDPSAKSRLSIKAMDVVLFGPPKVNRTNRIRDTIVSIVVVVMLSMCLIFYSKSRASESKLEAMKTNLCALQKAEEQMQDLQKELDKAVKAQEAVATEKKNLEEKLEERWSGKAPDKLKSLLQKTYDVESQYYHEKKQSLEIKATEVKLRNQKLQKKKATFLGYYKMAQENSLEEDINAIVQVKEAILQVTRQINERAERWRNIEQICGCSLERK